MANNVGQINKPYISAIPLLDEREIAPQIIDIQSDAAWTQYILESGRAQRLPAKIPHFDSFYNDPRYIIIDTTGSTVTNSGTTVVTITNLTTTNSNIAIVGHILLLSNGLTGRVQTRTTSGGQDTITVQSVSNNPLTLVAGDKLSVVGNAQEESSLAPSPQRWNLTSVRNNIQIFRTDAAVSDVQGWSQRTVKVNGDPHVIPQMFIDSLQQLMGQIAMQSWVGEASPTLFEDSSPVLTGVQGNAVQTTRGMNTYINLFGLQPSVATPGTITVFDLQDVCDQLTSRKAPDEYMMCGGMSPVTVMDVWLKNLGSSGATSVRLMGDGGDTNFMATQFSFGGYTFYLKREKLLSNPQTFNYVASGTTKQEVARRLYLLPYGKCPIYGGTDGNSGSMVDYWRFRYMESAPKLGKGSNTINSTSNGMIWEILTGGLAPQPTNQTSNMEVTFNSQTGLEVFSSQKFAGWTVQ